MILRYTRKHYLRFLTMLWILSSLSVRYGFADDPESIIARIEKKYGDAKDMTVSFSQTVQFGVTKNEQHFKGMLQVKKGNHYRIEMEDQTVVTDGKTVWSYSKINQQVLIDKYRDDPKSISPDKILVNVPKQYTLTALPSEKDKNGLLTVIKLVPKKSMSNVQWMKLWIDEDENVMRKIQVLDVTENLTTYEIEQIELNTGLSETHFTFDPPKGTEIIDLR